MALILACFRSALADKVVKLCFKGLHRTLAVKSLACLFEANYLVVMLVFRRRLVSMRRSGVLFNKGGAGRQVPSYFLRLIAAPPLTL